ncbi:MAG: hypothetical protein RIS92_1572 [Verrucomicrobiota bacterium]|jgi:hypothetical protein
MNKETLLLIALRDQAHTALEENVAPLEALPQDLLAILVDTQSQTEYKVLGFVIATEETRHYYRNGSEVQIDFVSTMAYPGQYYIKDEDYYTTFQGKPVPKEQIQIQTKTQNMWFAVVRGNPMELKDDLRQRGYTQAFSGSPAYCRVRPASEAETTVYTEMFARAL